MPILQPHCKYLKALRRYKKFLTTGLLALYVFIATPVSLWHHHKAQSRVASGTEKKIKAITTNSSDAGCPICQHQYSTIANDAVLFSLNTAEHIKCFSAFFQVQFLPDTAFSKPNKGPPFVA